MAVARSNKALAGALFTLIRRYLLYFGGVIPG